ncbi:thioredoxin-dependent thiol peroxidase [Oceaniglobus indicus]|uniref:thioredoxin-dependent thiol peroxidase n=1 Tax=Oceaniglobus indicus TaxID=2047749 RepID=UPI000C17C359|nr:thioredoxin-dependent thiol peroxidase [Oceaniglobus indicus]
MTDPLTGQKAPDFTLPRDGGGTVSLADLAGAPVVVYFYPRDDTPGCTREAIDFSEKAADFAARGATVLGISADSVAKHDRFRDKHDLSIALLSDEDAAVCTAYGVWVEKKMYGKTFMGIERATFVVGADGTIAQVWRKVKVPGHVDEVQAAVGELTGGAHGQVE